MCFLTLNISIIFLLAPFIETIFTEVFCDYFITTYLNRINIIQSRMFQIQRIKKVNQISFSKLRNHVILDIWYRSDHNRKITWIH